jgi:hypothetical protein
MDTGKVVGGAPLRTTFHLFPYLGTYAYPRLLLERGAYNPSLAESRVPFHQDPTQRIVALGLRLGAPDNPFSYKRPPIYPVVLVGALLELLQSREGSEIRWDEWKNHVIFPSLNLNFPGLVNLWISGCRLFFSDPIRDSQGARIKMFDFSVQGRARHLSEGVDEDLGRIVYLSPTEAEGEIKWDPEELVDVHAGHDSVVFSCVSVTVAKPSYPQA